MNNMHNIKLVSFNLHGFNAGLSMLRELCDDNDVGIVAIQEHWLTPDKLHLLETVHPEFTAYGISAMTNRLKSEIYRGRPYGGTAFLWRKSSSPFVSILSASDDGRCICIDFNADKHVRLFSVYFPCGDRQNSYTTEIHNILGYIECSIDAEVDVIVLGDFNFECAPTNIGYTIVRDVLTTYDVVNCDDLFIASTDDRFTYYHAGLDQKSFIDHFFCVERIAPTYQLHTHIGLGY
jgi:exonuclease III